MASKYKSIAISNPHKIPLTNTERFGFGLALLGVAILAVAFLGIDIQNKSLFLYSSLADRKSTHSSHRQ